jgi:hypothetical protein
MLAVTGHFIQSELSSMRFETKHGALVAYRLKFYRHERAGSLSIMTVWNHSE